MQQRSLFLSHLVCAGAPIVTFAVFAASSFGIALASLVGSIAALAAAWTIDRSLQRGLQAIHHVVATGEPPRGASPFDRFANELRKHIYRWQDTAGVAREELREVEGILVTLDRRQRQRSSSKSPIQELRYLLSSVGRDAGDVIKRLISSYSDIDRLDTQTSELAKLQLESAAHALVGIDVIAQGSGEVVGAGDRVCKVANELDKLTSNAAEQLNRYVGNFNPNRDVESVAEAKVRLLREQTIEIGSLVQAINEVAERTDMLALNASIESVRAGELGRGFAVVIDEIRKLASTVTQSSEEVLGRIAAIESDIDEASHSIASERDSATAQIQRISELSRLLQEASSSAASLPAEFASVTRLSSNQQQKIDELSENLQQFVQRAEDEHQRLLDRQWQLRSHADLASRLTDVLEPLLSIASGMTHPQSIESNEDSSKVEEPEGAPPATDHSEPVLAG